jgi:hypothetical protein
MGRKLILVLVNALRPLGAELYRQTELGLHSLGIKGPFIREGVYKVLQGDMVHQVRLGTRQSDLGPLYCRGSVPSGTWACAQTSLIHHTREERERPWIWLVPVESQWMRLYSRKKVSVD